MYLCAKFDLSNSHTRTICNKSICKQTIMFNDKKLISEQLPTDSVKIRDNEYGYMSIEHRFILIRNIAPVRSCAIVSQHIKPKKNIMFLVCARIGKKHVSKNKTLKIKRLRQFGSCA